MDREHISLSQTIEVLLIATFQRDGRGTFALKATPPMGAAPTEDVMVSTESTAATNMVGGPELPKAD